jgi:hypothetical protein
VAREAVVLIGEVGHDGDETELALVSERLREHVGDLGRPQELVFEVHQMPGAAEHLGVSAGDAASPSGAKA